MTEEQVAQIWTQLQNAKREISDLKAALAAMEQTAAFRIGAAIIRGVGDVEVVKELLAGAGERISMDDLRSILALVYFVPAPVQEDPPQDTDPGDEQPQVNAY